MTKTSKPAPTPEAKAEAAAKRAQARRRRIDEKAAAALAAADAAEAAKPSAAEQLAAEPAKPAPKANYFDTKPGRHAVLTTACPTCEQAAGLRCLGKKGTETIYIHPARMAEWEAAGSPEAARRTRQAAS